MSLNINIAENIRRLRTKHGVTQETIADFIGVSAQAVSKWERGDGLPDITMLPALANYFDVTLDELMGMDELRNRETLENMKREYKKLCSETNYEKAVEVMREVLRRFPNDYETMAALAEHEPDPEKALALCRRISDFCADSRLRSYAEYQESFLLFMLGRKEEALKKAESLSPLEYCREINVAWLLNGEERVKECQKTVMLLGWAFFGQIEQMASSGVYSAEECIGLYRKAIGFYELLYDDGNMGYSHLRLGECWFCMGLYALDLNQKDRAVEFFEKAAEQAKIFDSLPESKPFTSLLTDRCVFEKAKTSGVGTYKQQLRDTLKNKDNLKFGGSYDGDYGEFIKIFE